MSILLLFIDQVKQCRRLMWIVSAASVVFADLNELTYYLLTVISQCHGCHGSSATNFCHRIHSFKGDVVCISNRLRTQIRTDGFLISEVSLPWNVIIAT